MKVVLWQVDACAINMASVLDAAGCGETAERCPI